MKKRLLSLALAAALCFGLTLRGGIAVGSGDRTVFAPEWICARG